MGFLKTFNKFLYLENWWEKHKTQHQKKDLKDLLTFAYLSIDYKATQTNKHFYISFVNIASGKIYKNIDWLQIMKYLPITNNEIFTDCKWRKQETETRETTRERNREIQAPDIEIYIFFLFFLFYRKQ